MSSTLKIAFGSLAVGILVLLIKILAWWLTGSVALLSDALESTVNVATAIAAIVAIKIAALPADENHPYGHHKAEFFSALLEGVMIMVAALVIMQEAYTALRNPKLLNAPLVGLLINISASVINGVWCWILITRGRSLRSPALVADGYHLLSDVVSSVGVTFGVLLAILLQWPILDPLLALLVAVNILWSGWKVINTSLSGLMDEAVPDDVLEKIKATIAREASGALQAHDVKTRHAGSATFIEFDLVVPGDMRVVEAHDICDRIEDTLKKDVAGAIISIHVEPENKAKRTGVVEI
ncbi:MAG: cation transporter [Hyphomicrobiales bacterium]|nr:cation transporter [Hyphomicrobiales bacterium]